MRFTAAGLEPYDRQIRQAVSGMELGAVISRIWRKDATVWKEKDVEISDRLGWLEAPEKAAGMLPGIDSFVQEVREAGYEHALLLGMGGSSLAPEVFSRVFGTQKGYLTLDVLDSTDPEAALSCAEGLPCEKTIFIASSKSGTTLETTSFLNFFYTRARESLGREQAGAHFAAITDPGTPLERTALDLGFRRVFHGDPNVGGRFSVLSAFGLLPAALLGMDIPRLLARARQAAGDCRTASPRENPGAYLGLLLGVMATAGRDKAVFLLSPGIEGFGAWIEQLLAESTGKEGRGILPLVRDAGFSFERDAPDLLVVHIGIAGDGAHAERLRQISANRTPLVSCTLEDVHDLGYQFFLWEMATAAAGHILKVNPFDQPNVAASKKKTKAVLKAVQERGGPAGTKPADEDELRRFLSRAEPGDYVVVQAFLPPEPALRACLQEFAAAIRAKTDLAVTYDFGPRFLHSTGQLHKGDRGNGLFIQLTAGHLRDAAVPAGPGSSSSSYSFGVLIDAQALGDREALREKGRRVIRFHFHERADEGIRRLIESL
jgi:glucose-6-phosphate isomerase